MRQNGAPKYSKVLEIGPIPPPHAGWGVRIGYLLEGLRSRQIDAKALDLGPNRKVRRPESDTVPTGFAYAWKVVWYLLRGYRIHTHLNGESLKAYALVLYSSLLSRLFFRPAVLTWHGGLGYRWFPSEGNVFVDTVHKLIFWSSAKIICNDDQIKRHIVAYGINAEKVLPIPAFSKQYLEYEPVSLATEIEQFIESRDPLLFCYTYYRPEFYLPVLVEALGQLVKQHADLGLLLVGYTAGYEPVRDQVETAGLSGHVCFAGDLDRQQFLTALGRSDLCVRTHKRDGISSSVLESLSLGIPVVAADNPLRPEQVERYEAESSRDLADAVLRVLSRPPALRRPDAPPIADTVAEEIAILVGSPDQHEWSR